jgi:hypothetical protein
VEPRKYRLRFLNGSNSRFYNLDFAGGPVFHHIGSEGGMFAAPVRTRRILILPAERADVIVDFAGFEPLDPAPAELAEQTTEGAAALLAGERESASERLAGPGAHGDGEDVEAELVPSVCHGVSALGVHASKRAEANAGAAVPRDRRQVEAVRLADIERLGAGQRPIHELPLGTQEIDLDPLLREGPQRKHLLDGGNAAAGDKNQVGPRSSRGTHPSASCAAVGVEELLLLEVDEHKRQAERNQRARPDGRDHGATKAEPDPSRGDQRRVAGRDHKSVAYEVTDLAFHVTSLVTSSFPRRQPRRIRRVHGIDIGPNY